MSNTKLVPTWTFQHSLPEPFDVYSGSSAVFKNISSRYCTQPQKRQHSTPQLCRQCLPIWIWKILQPEKLRKN